MYKFERRMACCAECGDSSKDLNGALICNWNDGSKEVCESITKCGAFPPSIEE